jgi:Family of unknown function (DUF6228)
MSRSLELASSRDRTRLSLSNFVGQNDSPAAETFLVTVEAVDIRAEMRVSSYMASSLATYFANLARASWNGWSGEWIWATLEEDLRLSASIDRTGHIKLRYEMRPNRPEFDWSIHGAVELEVGRMEAIAQQAKAAWPHQGAA